MTTIKHPKAIQSKSRTHTVGANGDGTYTVTSGHSGAQYTVSPDGAGWVCSCDWSKYRPLSDQRCGCSHVVAVVNFIAAQSDRKAMAWATPEDAARQHRPSFSIGDGVIITLRLAES